jgi:pimeloyl-ACP methyl ester carboxylesterase
MDEFRNDFRCITMDLRNSNVGESSGPLQIDKPWDAYASDQLGLMDHLGIREFAVLGCRIGGPFALKLMEIAPSRVIAGVLCQPSGFRPESPDAFWDNNIGNWGPRLCARRPEVTMQMVEAILHNLYRANPDFVFSVTRDFVRSCRIPMLVMPDNVPERPWQVSMDIFKLAPNAQVSMYPWKEPKELLPAAIAQARTFLLEHQPLGSRR